MKSKTKGILFIILSAFSFACMNMCVRLAGDLPSIQKSFFRNFVAAIFAGMILYKKKIKFSGEKENLKDLIMRSVFGTLGILCNFYAIDHLVLSDASLLNKMSPFFAIIFSYFLLKEKINPVQWMGLCVAFIGCLFVIKPSVGMFSDLAALLGLFGGMSAGLAYTLVRRLGERGEKGPFVVFFFSAFSCIATLPFMIAQYHAMTWEQLIILLLAGLFAAGGQFSITAAYFHAPAKEISVYDYSQIVFAAILGYLMFEQKPDLYSVIGYILIVGTAVFMYIYGRNNQKR